MKVRVTEQGVVIPRQFLEGVEEVEFPEEHPDAGLPPDGVPLDLPHHGGEPGIAGSAGSEDPDQVLRPHAPGAVPLRPQRQDLPVPLVQQLKESLYLPVPAIHSVLLGLAPPV